MNRNTLPPLSYYPQPQGIENHDFSNSLPIVRSQTPLLDNNNNNNNNFLANQNMIKEIRELKMSLKSQLENQNELQKKLIDSYKLISQQDNIIRLNTSKINEHDIKLTNILSSFNNLLKVQEATSNTLKDCQDKIQHSLCPIETFNLFKNQVQNNNSIIKEQLTKIFQYNDSTDLILNDLKNTDQNNLNLLLKKIKVITDKEENFFADKHQENLDYIKEHYGVISSKINQLKEFIDGVQAQLGEEINIRKVNDDKIIKDVSIYINQKYDEKFKVIEKNSLETEKNLINMNKDYVKSLQEIIAKQKEGNDSEFQNIKHMIEIGLKKNQVKYDNDINDMKKLVTNVNSELNETKSTIEKIDSFVKENIKIMNEFQIKGDSNLIDFSNKIKQIEQDSLNLYEETRKKITKELEDNIAKEKEGREEYEKNVNEEIASKLYSYDNNINDLKEQCTQLKKMVENKYDKGSSKDDGTNAIGIKILKFDEVYTNKLNKLNKDIQDNHTKLQEDVEKKINSIRNYIKKNMDDYSVHLDNDLYKKFDVLSKDFKENIDKLKLEYDVKLQDYIVECEVRLNKKYEELTKK